MPPHPGPAPGPPSDPCPAGFGKRTVSMDNRAVRTPRTSSLIVCHECDLLQSTPHLAPGATACCARCGARLFRVTRDGLDRCLALTLAAGVLFVIANLFPIVIIDLQGQTASSTLLGAVRALHAQGRPIVALLVFVTTVLVPAIEMLAIAWMLAPLRFGRVAPGLRPCFRWVQRARPWGMLEVFMLGVLVSVAKLSHVAVVLPGLALWSFGGLVLLLAAAASSFDGREMWSRVERLA